MINEVEMSGELQRLTSHLGVAGLDVLGEERWHHLSGGEKAN